MTKGVVLIAQNNKEVDYVKQAAFLAKRIEKYLNLPNDIKNIQLPLQMWDIIKSVMSWSQALCYPS
jgi:hypothetical protein